jgi:uncharacterized membrane protein YphA (DoxX/SURF4 family)
MKKNTIIFWVATIIIFLMEGIMPISTLLFAPQYTNAGTKPLGYPDYFAVALILCKFLGSLAILLPQVPAKLKEWAYAGLTFNLLFAVLSHVIVDKNIGYILMPLVVLLILAISYRNKDKLNMASKNSVAAIIS